MVNIHQMYPNFGNKLLANVVSAFKIHKNSTFPLHCNDNLAIAPPII